MPQPTAYDRQFNFQNQQALTPDDPLPANQVDAELNAVKITLDEILANLELIQRDDGDLANASVGEDQLAPDLALLGNSLIEILAIQTALEADAAAADLSATAAAASAAAAAASALAAAGSETTAGNSASTAVAAKDAAITAKLAAEAAQTAAAASAGAAATSKTAAELAETNAETAQAAAEAAKTAAETAETNAETAETNAETAETNAAASAVAAAASAAKLVGTSTSSVAIATGSKGFTTQASKFFDVGFFLLITSDADPANYMHGQVTAYSGTSLTVNVTNTGGSGTHADWTIRVSGTRGAVGATGATGPAGSGALTIVRAASTGNVALATALENGDTLDGVTLATGDLVLVNAQSAPAENGVYVVPASGAASRSTDFDAYDEHPGVYFSVREGSANADTLWLCTSNTGGTINSTALAITKVLAGTAALTRALLGLATSDSPEFTAVNIGAAADTTVSRPAPGRLQIEGEELLSTKDLSAALTSTQKSLLRGNTGSPSVIRPQGRLTLTTATPVLTSTVSAQTTIYYTPYVGCLAPLYDGTYWTPTVFSELSQATTDSTKSPAACTTNSNYDLFVWDDSGTLRCTRGPAWSSSTSRGTGAGTTELVRVNGILLNANAITNGPGASRGTYVGTIRTNGSSQVDFIFGASGTGGVAGVVGVWNAYNRVKFSHFVRDDTNSWTYNGAYRSSNASTAMRVSFVRGLNEDGVFAFAAVMMTNSASSAGHAGICLDNTNDNNGTGGEGAVNTSGAQPCCYANPAVGLGFHFLQLTEATTGAAVNVTFMGDNGSQANYGNGLIVEAMA